MSNCDNPSSCSSEPESNVNQNISVKESGVQDLGGQIVGMFLRCLPSVLYNPHKHIKDIVPSRKMSLDDMKRCFDETIGPVRGLKPPRPIYVHGSDFLVYLGLLERGDSVFQSSENVWKLVEYVKDLLSEKGTIGALQYHIHNALVRGIGNIIRETHYLPEGVSPHKFMGIRMAESKFQSKQYQRFKKRKDLRSFIEYYYKDTTSLTANAFPGICVNEIIDNRMQIEQGPVSIEDYYEEDVQVHSGLFEQAARRLGFSRCTCSVTYGLPGETDPKTILYDLAL